MKNLREELDMIPLIPLITQLAAINREGIVTAMEPTLLA